MADQKRERAVFLLGENPIRQIDRGEVPEVAIGVDISWDEDAQAWRADWEGGVQFGASKLEAALNGLQERLVAGT